jgi:hypothetical protein
MKDKLLPRERNDALWIKIKTMVEVEIDTLRRKNDATSTDLQTEKLRGRIAALKDLLAIGEEQETTD